MAKKVLIVDDAIFMRNMIKDIFAGSGFEVVGEATNGPEASPGLRLPPPASGRRGRPTLQMVHATTSHRARVRFPPTGWRVCTEGLPGAMGCYPPSGIENDH